jgi:urocanate hydratase
LIAPDNVLEQYDNNLKWIQKAEDAKLVVGSQARILYSDQLGRINIGLAFNEAVRSGQLKGPVILSRDHHDVSGTDSPFRETANIDDGSAFCAGLDIEIQKILILIFLDMSVQNVIGDSFRGATWVALHNGGGVGFGEVMNGKKIFVFFFLREIPSFFC